MSGSGDGSTSPQSWVQFENEETPAKEDTDSANPASLPPPPSRASVTQQASTPAVIDATSIQIQQDNNQLPHNNRNGSSSIQPIATPLTSPNPPNGGISGGIGSLQTIPLNDPVPPPPSQQRASNIRQGFANGDVIVTLLPQNTSMAWITPATFRPELVPEELMAQGLTLTVEDYVHVMTQLVNDNRFKLFNICYKRIVIAWIAVGFIILLSILFFSGGRQLELFGAGIAWLLLNAGAIFLCMWIKIRLNRGLERCMAGINLQLMKHKILLGLDDRGKLSCHKVNLCFIYFDPSDCLSKLQQLIEDDARAVASADGATRPLPLHTRLDIDDPDIIISGATTTRISRDQERCKMLLARYTQRWVKAVCRGRLTISIDSANTGVVGITLPASRMAGVAPRHISTKQCPCQFVEEHINYKPQGCFGVCDVWRYSNGVVLPNYSRYSVNANSTTATSTNTGA